MNERIAALEQGDRANHVLIVFPAEGAMFAGFLVSHHCCGGGEKTYHSTDRAALLALIEADLHATITKGLHAHILTPFYEQNHSTKPEVI
ncbi:MAG: hypothetical protein ACSLE5_05550 [Porticoccaceae bacterium]